MVLIVKIFINIHSPTVQPMPVMINDWDYYFFLIRPVSGVTQEVDKRIGSFVSSIEKRQRHIYDPKRDTDQTDDGVGLNIFLQNKKGIVSSREVRIFYDPKSDGSVFDLGMTFMSGKDLFVYNVKDLVYDEDIFASRFVCSYAKGLNSYIRGVSEEEAARFLSRLGDRKQEILESRVIPYTFTGRSPEFFFDFGMCFMSGKPLYLINREDVEKVRTRSVSFQNVLLALDDQYRSS